MTSEFQPSRAATDNRWAPFLAFGAFVLVLFGIKLWVIAAYGNATPLCDQWDAEATNLYAPFLEGRLRWADMLAPHNEHRIFTHRVLALALFAINGNWNPLFQMVVNAAVHVLAIGFGIALLTRVVGRHHLPALLLFSLLLFGIPYAWENTLGGFHAQFYLVFPFSFAGLWFLTSSAPLSLRWWSGTASALLAFLSLASGLLVPAVAAVVGLVLYASRRRRTRQQLIAIALLAGLFVLEALLTPRISFSEPSTFKAASLSQFFDALFAALSWPIASSFVSALVRNLPALVFGVVLLWRRPSTDDRKWFLLALVVWMFGQSVSLAYGRAVGTLASRYLDTFAFGVLVNFACMISLAQEHVGKRRSWTLVSAAGWLIAVVIFLGLYSDKNVPTELAARKSNQLEQELNTRNFLATGDYDWLKGKSFPQIPHFKPGRLGVLLASPTVRAFLPPNIRPPLVATSIESDPADAFVADGYYLTTPKREGWSLGSYGPLGDSTTGKASIRFDANQHSGVLAIPVAGYPLDPGLLLELEQDGRVQSVTLKRNPRESWATALVTIDKGPFTIVLTDTNRGSAGWLAIGTPVPQGKWDAFTKDVLADSLVFILLGLAAAILSAAQYGLMRMARDEASAAPAAS